MRYFKTKTKTLPKRPWKTRVINVHGIARSKRPFPGSVLRQPISFSQSQGARNHFSHFFFGWFCVDLSGLTHGPSLMSDACAPWLCSKRGASKLAACKDPTKILIARCQPSDSKISIANCCYPKGWCHGSSHVCVKMKPSTSKPEEKKATQYITNSKCTFTLRRTKQSYKQVSFGTDWIHTNTHTRIYLYV